MKVLHCIPHLSGGGAERQLFYLAREMARCGHPQHIAYVQSGPRDPVFPEGVVLHRLRAGSNYDPLLIMRLFRLVRKVNPDVVQTWILQMDVIGGIVARWLSIPWTLREASSSMAWPDTFKNNLRFWLARKASGVACNSLEGMDLWKSKGRPSRRKFIRNAVPVDEIVQKPEASLEKFGISGNDPVILFAGRFDQWAKNIPTLVKALIRVMRQRKCDAILCGEGPGLEEARELARQGGFSEQIRFPGFSNDVPGLMKKADLFVSVSIFEGQPNAVQEAMACRCPLVLSDIPAHRALVDEGSCWFVPTRDAEGIARGILKALDQPETGRRQAEEAFARLEPFFPEQIAGQYIQFYREITGVQ